MFEHKRARLYCGMVLLIAVGIFAVPIVHRFLRHFHLENEGMQKT